jgi:hypothetical protein
MRPRPIYLHHYDLDTLEEQSASGYRACGMAETAIAILERKMRATPETLFRDRGHQQAKLANTVIATAQPDLDRAVALGLSCIGVATTTGSARIVKELWSLDRTLTTRWPTFAGTKEFHRAVKLVAGLDTIERLFDKVGHGFRAGRGSQRRDCGAARLKPVSQKRSTNICARCGGVVTLWRPTYACCGGSHRDRALRIAEATGQRVRKMVDVTY